MTDLQQSTRDQQHPQYKSDRDIANNLLNSRQPTERDLAELARLKIRYQGFPGARDIQRDLERIMKQWNYTEDTLFETTREIHAKGLVYRGNQSDREDWV
ncbi:DUF3288 family protein [Lyngbya sp. CCY1209]|jgi:hypothetical protein|uniref:DUF3288 family protein n=1 Tax=Lyngbya sp. CCY1209 TaxID=2886103 RepID=UPI002D20E9C8|nr:DUF3288 family protein [Lyngbya sp. CCY1209]MEB3883977.1 DUF3288 family protein [Lyngbya sp. CCY1209]